MSLAGVPAGLVVFTDLDGCLLDEQTYSWAPAREALGRLRVRRVPLVLCSSKTREEIETLAAELDLAGPYIAENGGVIVIPEGHLPVDPPGARRAGGRLVVATGVLRDRLVRELAELAAHVGVRVRGFAGQSADELSRLTGLDVTAAERAGRREYDEPFQILDDVAQGLPALERAAQARRLRVTAGGRFFHLMGETDKGRAVERLLSWYRTDGRRISSVGLGDAANDLTMLQAVDRPIVIPRPDGQPDPTLARALPDAERAPGPGPAGWNEAILAVLRGDRLSAVCGAPLRGEP